MANIDETVVWEESIHELGLGEPVIGGPDGVDNLPHKQLANRTKWLKGVADQVIAAAAGYGDIGERLDQMGILDPTENAAHYAAIFGAFDMAGALRKQLNDATRRHLQTGEIVFLNRGIVSGLGITKSSTANRNLNIDAGAIFIGGKVYTIPAGTNVASVPQNTSMSTAGSAYVYLSQLVSGLWSVACTQLGDLPPDGTVTIGRLQIPANNTDANDAHLANVVVVRDAKSARIEPNYPMLMSRAPYFYQPIAQVPSERYQLTFDIVSAVGAPCTPDNVVVTSRATNGFGILITSAADSIRLRWTLNALV